MQNRWSTEDAGEFVRRYAKQGVAEDVALRIYSSRLLGAEPRLVQHGGGNTSLKTRVKDLLGREADVICVKGSGWDLEFIEPAGLPALRLPPLLALRLLKTLSDEQMVNEQRGALLDAGAPNPSVETLLHAWVPRQVIDHTHSNAILSLTDQPDGDAICRDLFGDRLAIVPYCMPGFALAHLAADTFDAHPSALGMILLKHGIFTWGETARESYARMIEFVSLAEDRIASRAAPKRGAMNVCAALDPTTFVPVLRGGLMRASGKPSRVVLEWRNSPEVLAYVSGKNAARYSQAGVATPDHVIRTKPWPLLLSNSEAELEIDAAVANYVTRYAAYFERGNAASLEKKSPLDPTPRVVLVPGLGLFGVGDTRTQARITADIAETTIAIVNDAERVGHFESISEREVFEMEHWSLEQAKLSKARRRSLAGSIVAVTGGAGRIGAAIAQAFADQGAELAVLDIDIESAERVAKVVKGVAMVCDVTSTPSVDRAFAGIVRKFGGLDVLVSNAGAAWQGRIGTVSDQIMRDSFELNFFGHQRVAQAAVRIMDAQRSGGCLLFNASKQALNPGAEFGPYGAAKAATIFLARQYAVDHGKDGIRSNVVNADRIRSGLLTEEMIAKRSTARGVSETEYMSGNLLGREVTAIDVAEAFVALALSTSTTGSIFTVDGGNIAAAPR